MKIQIDYNRESPLAVESSLGEMDGMILPAPIKSRHALLSEQAAKPYRADLQEIVSGDAFNKRALLELTRAQTSLIHRVVHALSELDSDQEEVTALYEFLKEQIPSVGRIRVIDAAELGEILAEGCLQRGKDFALPDQGARIGHNGRFACLLCKPESHTRFGHGPAGNSEINIDRIPIEDLCLYIPVLPMHLTELAKGRLSSF